MTSTLCPTCSCRIPAHAPEGLCPRCLVSAGLVGSLGTQPASAGTSDLLSVEELGELLPHREIEALIGRGGMGAVYLARDPRLGRRLAIKVLSGELAADPAFVERFAREARAVARLEHPNVVQIHQFVDDLDLPYLELEFVPGQSLRQLLGAGPLRLDRAREILRQVAAGLGYAHREGVVHRDVKPENVLVDEDGRVRLVDFGLAKITKGRAPGSLTLTGARQVVGTIHYMAPEQLEAPETVDARSDVYSWGVIAYEVLTGRLPLGRFGPPSRYAEVGPELDAIVLKALEREPEDRFADGGALRNRLEGVAGGLVEASLSSSEIGHEVGREVGREKSGSSSVACGLVALALVLACGLLLVGVLLFFLLWEKPSSPRELTPLPRSLPTPGPSPRAATPQELRIPTQAGLAALEAGIRLQSRIAASQPELAASAASLARRDGTGAYASADKAVRILAEGTQDLALLRADPQGQDAARQAGQALDEAREAALCARIQAAVLSPTLARFTRAKEDLAGLIKGGRREEFSSRVLSASGALRLLEGKALAGGEDFLVWREREPKSVAATLGLARARIQGDEPAEAAELLEGIWTECLGTPLAFEVQKQALIAARETGDSEAAARWLGRLPATSDLPKAGLLRAEAFASRGDLFGALGELRAVFEVTRQQPSVLRDKVYRLAAETFLAFELPKEARTQVKLLGSTPMDNTLEVHLLEGLIDASEALPGASAALQRVASEAAPWEWPAKASALRALAKLSFEAGELEEARVLAKRAYQLNWTSCETRACLARILSDPHFEGQYLDDALQLCKKAQGRRETSRLTALHAWILTQQFPFDLSRARRVARQVPARTAQPLLLDLRDRGSEQAALPRNVYQLWRAQRQGSHLAGRACALGQRFESEAKRAPDAATRDAALGRAKLGYRRALWHYPYHLPARLGLARIAQAKGELQSALAHAKLAYQQHPQVPAAAMAAGALLAHEPGAEELQAALMAVPKAHQTAPSLVAANQAAGHIGGRLADRLGATPQARIAFAESMLSAPNLREYLLPNSKEASEARVLTLRALAKSFERVDPEAAKLARARADGLEQEFQAARKKQGRRLRALLEAARARANDRDLESALAKAREACTLAPDRGIAWAAYADLSLRMRQPREALRASACAAWLDEDFLPLFLICLRYLDKTGASQFGDAPPRPKGPGLGALLETLQRLLGDPSSSELTKTVHQELSLLDTIYPDQLVIASLMGHYDVERSKFDRALLPLHYLARVRPDQPPFHFLAGAAAAGLRDPQSQPYGDTLAVLALRQAAAMKLDFDEGVFPQRLRASKAWAWVSPGHPLDPSKK